MAAPAPTFKLDTDDNARRAPVRLVVVQGDREPAVDGTDEDLVMTFPHLVVRELVALLALSLALVAAGWLFVPSAAAGELGRSAGKFRLPQRV